MCGEANTQSPGLGYGERRLHAHSDSAVCASSGTSFREASVFGAPSTIATTDRRMCKMRFSKSTSCQRRPINSPRRGPEKASNSIVGGSGWTFLGPFPSDRIGIERTHDVSDLCPAALCSSFGRQFHSCDFMTFTYDAIGNHQGHPWRLR